MENITSAETGAAVDTREEEPEETIETSGPEVSASSLSPSVCLATSLAGLTVLLALE